MRVVYSPAYRLDLGPHVFPTEKYHRVAGEVSRLGLVPAGFTAPVAASWEDLALVHTAAYLEALRTGTLSAEDIARLEIPCTPAIVEGFRYMTGGTLVATDLALDGVDRVAVHIGGGFHHAFAGHGEGFCIFNDIAVAIRRALAARRIALAAVLDLDVHQGNGTAAIFAGDPRVFTASLHEQDNYPVVKPPGSIDVGLARGTGDEPYLAALDGVVERVLARTPDLVVYVAGADPYEDDQLGRLGLTRDGLRRRDRLVFGALASAGVPVVVVLAGGYARRLDDTVAIHAATIDEAASA
ncbi:MAG: histone deacetylase [Vicinamibacterales bacterium]